MLGDWEEHPLRAGMVPDMSPRHASETRFRPRSLSVRRDEDGRVVIVKISGDRLINGQPFPGSMDIWEWDRDRDPGMEWIADLISTVADRKGTGNAE